MSASMRIELFPASLETFLDFYCTVLKFELLQRKGTYAYIKRDGIYIGAIETPNSESIAERKAYRQPYKGVELVLEVDNLKAERDRIVATGYILDADLQVQEWGLEDFRLTDPDGYYLRITNRYANKDA